MNNLVNLYLRENDKVGQVINDGIFVESLSNLYRMDLVKCNITHLDMNVFINLTKLEILELSKNPLFSLPSAIKVLPRLFALWMFQTNVTTII
uniref:Uncharacterized protein n=1 Tax=Panagrolaimus superbus TaxID=310955 RepID=A0A914YQY8_9BILA